MQSADYEEAVDALQICDSRQRPLERQRVTVGDIHAL
jgi:hypothetical protein